MLKTIAGTLLIILGIADGWKYIIWAEKIRKAGTSKGSSRFVINMAWWVDLGKILCGFIVLEKWLVITTFIGLLCVWYLFFITYLNYNYKMRGLSNFKRPNIILYTINSMLPNSIRKRL